MAYLQHFIRQIPSNLQLCFIHSLKSPGKIKVLKEWTDVIIVKIPKKGNLCDCDNWRGICVLPMVAKFISKIIVERLKQYLYSTIDAEPAGFRPGSSCTDQAKFYMANPKQSATLLHALITDACGNESFPSEWTDRIIVKIPKKDNLHNCVNWRVFVCFVW